jgi:secreted PhoX family phosphatase
MVKDSPFNRRITADTKMEITGPARGHDLMKTKADAEGAIVLGTWNNCGSGRTPWGTYLTCEENFNGYFSSSDKSFEPGAAMNRYGVRNKDWGYGWREQIERLDISKHPHEPNRFGYVVEIDPWNPKSTPRKLTALGRLKHENAEVVVAGNGHVVVYMGDDERGEFLYRFVSDGKFSAGADNSGLLEAGKLYAARFTDDMRGEWVELTPQATGLTSQAEICIHTRQAASAVNATTMDRPEWVAANPHGSDVYCCLTNDPDRGIKPNAGGDATPASGPNPRRKNLYGQIVRWRPNNDDHTAADFTWDLFVLAGNPEVYSDAMAGTRVGARAGITIDPRVGSRNVTADNMFNSPDGLAFDSRGLLWIRTDGNYSNRGDFAGMGNNQMLIADPATGEIRRFMVGPRECEVSGLAWSPDRKTAFVGIQHPGRKGGGHFPDGGSLVPRSCVIAVVRDDGGTMG